MIDSSFEPQFTWHLSEFASFRASRPSIKIGGQALRNCRFGLESFGLFTCG
jgi:hypothetical protein